MQSIFHAPCRYKNILLVKCTVLGNEKSISIPVALENSGNKIFSFGKCVASSFDPMDYFLRIQFIQKTAQASAMIAVQIQKSNHISKCELFGFVRPDELEHFAFLSLCQHISVLKKVLNY